MIASRPEWTKGTSLQHALREMVVSATTVAVHTTLHYIKDIACSLCLMIVVV